MIRTLILPTLACLLLSVSPLAADPIEYTSLAAWMSAVTNPTTVNFNSLSDGLFLGNGTYDGIGISNSDDFVEAWGPGEGGCAADDSGVCLLVHAGPTTITLPASEGAFALDMGAFFSGGPLVFDPVFDISGTTTLGAAISAQITVPISQNGLSPYTFVGFTLDPGDTISSFTVENTTSTEFALLNNVAYGAAATSASTPEPGTFTLWLAGVCALAIAARRRAAARS